MQREEFFTELDCRYRSHHVQRGEFFTELDCRYRSHHVQRGEFFTELDCRYRSHHVQRGEFFTELDCRYRQPGEPGEEREIDSIALLKPWRPGSDDWRPPLASETAEEREARLSQRLARDRAWRAVTSSRDR